MVLDNHLDIQEELVKATYEYFEKNPDKLKNLFARILEMPDELEDRAEDANGGLVFTMMEALTLLCDILRLHIPPDGTHWSIHISDLKHRIQGRIDQQKDDRRKKINTKSVIVIGVFGILVTILIFIYKVYNDSKSGDPPKVSPAPAAAVMKTDSITAD